MPTGKARPGHRDDDQIWLLERLVGLIHANGKGTDSTAIPRGAPSSPVLHYVRLTPTNLTASSVVGVQLPTTTRQWRLLSIQAHRVSGAATTWAPHFGQVAAFTIDGADDRLGLTPQAFSAPYRKVFCSAVPMKSDNAAKIYLAPQLNAGTDNDLDVQLWFIQDFETEESS